VLLGIVLDHLLFDEAEQGGLGHVQGCAGGAMQGLEHGGSMCNSEHPAAVDDAEQMPE
jgi:hypothetical protein